MPAGGEQSRAGRGRGESTPPAGVAQLLHGFRAYCTKNRQSTNARAEQLTEILTSAQMRAIERAAIDSGAVSGAALMERAGAAVVAAVLAEWPELAAAPGRAVVLCGPGHNGGDGFVVARKLAERGWRVDLRLWGDPARLPPEAAAMRDLWCAQGAIRPASDPPEGPCDLIVDAVFGIGLTRPVADPVLRAWFRRIDGATEARMRRRSGPGGAPLAPRTVAVDVPSGLDADTGGVPGGPGAAGGGAPRVLLTVTFHALKPGHLSGDGPDLCGRVVVADIGLGPWDRHRHDA